MSNLVHGIVSCLEAANINGLEYIRAAQGCKACTQYTHARNCSARHACEDRPPAFKEGDEKQ